MGQTYQRHSGGWLRLALGIALTLSLIVAYELGVRRLTPDAMEYVVQSGGALTPPSTQSGTITNAATVAILRALVAAPHPTSQLRDAYFGHGCSVGGWTTVSLRFTWHGLPVEVVSPGPRCAFAWSEVSRGGLPDPNLYYIAPGDFSVAGLP